MKATVGRTQLRKAAVDCWRATPGRATLPILENAMIEARGDALRLTSYDMEIGLAVTIPAEVVEPGAITVPCRTLRDMLGKLDSRSLEIEDAEKSTLRITANKTRFTIHGLPAEEFPLLPDVGDSATFTMQAAKLRSAIKRTIYAASCDQARAILTGLCFTRGPGSTRLVATDSYRVAVQVIGKARMVPKNFKAILPARALQVANAILPKTGYVEARFGGQQASLCWQGYRLVSRMIDGDFPNYQRVVPDLRATTCKVRVDTKGLKRAVEVAAIASQSEASKIILHAVNTGADMLHVYGESGDTGTVGVELPAQVMGKEIEIAFNADYLTDMLATIGVPTCDIYLTEPLASAVFRPAKGRDFLYVLMPMQI